MIFIFLNDISPRLKWCRNTRQFKDIPSSTCLNDSERVERQLQIAEALGSIFTEVTF